MDRFMKSAMEIFFKEWLGSGDETQIRLGYASLLFVEGLWAQAESQ